MQKHIISFEYPAITTIGQINTEINNELTKYPNFKLLRGLKPTIYLDKKTNVIMAKLKIVLAQKS